MSALTSRAWSPWVTGAIIGLLQVPAFMLIGTALGASSSYVTVAAHLGALLDPGIVRIEYAAKHLEGAKNWWQVALVGGIALGAFLSSRLSGTARSGVAPVWTRALSSGSRLSRMGLAFVGGFVMLAGARIADGCTSGHGISGTAQLALGSMIAVAAMFAGGILTAQLFRRI